MMENTLTPPKPSSSSSNTASVMSAEDKLKIVRSVGDECPQEDELLNLLAVKPHPIFCDWVQSSANMPIDQVLMKAKNVNKLTSAGCKVKLLLADWSAFLNNKLKGDIMKTNEVVGQYMIEIWKAVGMNLDQVEFLFSSKEIISIAPEYWFRVLKIAQRYTVEKSSFKEEYELSAAQNTLDPCMKCADIFFFEADICQLGMDQQKVIEWARDYCDVIGRQNKPISLSHHMLAGLQNPGKEITKSNIIFMDDDAAEVNKKIKLAYCPPKVVLGNPCIEYIKLIVLPWLNEFKVERSDKNGGNKIYTTIEELNVDYESGQLHPGDLKPSLSKALNKILQPVRDHLKNDPVAKDLPGRVKGFK